MGQFENFLSKSFRRWWLESKIQTSTKERILRQAALEVNKAVQLNITPDHLQAWNLPGRKSGTSDFGRFRFGAVLAPYYNSSLKLMI